jgi:hypothetical protein
MGNAPRIRDEDDPFEKVFEEDQDRIINDDYYYDRSRRRSRREVVKTDAAEQDVDAMRRRWKNRRRMAWLSLLAMFTMTYFVFFTDYVDIERMRVLKEVVTWFYFACISIVGAYMGFTTWADRGRTR